MWFLKLHLGVTSPEDGGVSYGELANALWKAELTPCIGGYGVPLVRVGGYLLGDESDGDING